MDNIRYDWEKIGRRIRTEREQYGYSQDVAAEAADVKRQTLSKWERNIDCEIPLRALLGLCNLFQCDIGYLLCEYDCKTRPVTDVHKLTGLSEKAINSLVERKNSPATPPNGSPLPYVPLEMLSDLVCRPDFWMVLRSLSEGREEADVTKRARNTQAGEGSIYHTRRSTGSSITLTGEQIQSFYINEAVNGFTVIASQVIKEQGGECYAEKSE